MEAHEDGTTGLQESVRQKDLRSSQQTRGEQGGRLSGLQTPTSQKTKLDRCHLFCPVELHIAV